MPFFKRLKRFGYINCVMTIDDLTDRSDYELFTKVCSASHSLYHLLPPYPTSYLHLRGHPFQLPDYYTDMHKRNRSLFDLCMNTLNEIVYFSCIAFLCFLLLLCFLYVLLLVRVLICVCRILIKITYLLTYLHNFTISNCKCFNPMPLA